MSVTTASAAGTGSDRILLSAYLDARYRIPGLTTPMRVGASWRYDLPGLGRIHAVLTACNPRSQPLCDVDNRQRSATLAELLDRVGHRWQPALNQAADGSWPEPSFWLPNVPLAVLDTLADRFGQNACVVIAADEARLRLRLYRHDWHAAHGDHPWLQWPCR